MCFGGKALGKLVDARQKTVRQKGDQQKRWKQGKRYRMFSLPSPPVSLNHRQIIQCQRAVILGEQHCDNTISRTLVPATEERGYLTRTFAEQDQAAGSKDDSSKGKFLQYRATDYGVYVSWILCNNR